LDLDVNGKLKKLSSKQLKDIIENYSDTDECDSDKKPYLFKDHFDKFISSKDNARTKDIYQATLNKIKKYSDVDDITFEDINISWLKSFQQKMSNEGLAINAQGIHFRNIRAVFNDAIDEELISQNVYPFRKFKIKKEATIKRSLTVEELIKLRDYPCEEYQKKYRDMFMLIFYLIGINTIDLLYLKEIKNGRIEYRRHKTKRLYSIEILPEAMLIIESYRGENYLLNALDTYSHYKGYANKINKNLQEIGDVEFIEKKVKGKISKMKKIKSLFPDLSTYWARHTWATIAASLDIPKETIAAALGHGGNSVTDIYINFDQKKIDEANRKVLGYVRGYEVKEPNSFRESGS
jgi:site-specific recombinase XerD